MKELQFKDIGSLEFFYVGNSTNKAYFMRLRLGNESICMDSNHEHYQKNMRVDFAPEERVFID